MTSMRIGESAPRGDAAAKATGREHYAADACPENLIWAQAVRPGVPCGRILKLDTRAALAVPGVLKVLLAKDVPGSNRQGIIHKDMPVLMEDRIRCCGDAVALVLAETRAAATLGASRVAVDIEPLAGVFDLEAAMAPGAPLVHADRAGNLLARAVIRKGVGADAFSVCDVVVESVFTTPVQAHAFLETESGIARLQDDGDLLMEVSTQSPFRDRFEIGHALGMANPAMFDQQVHGGVAQGIGYALYEDFVTDQGQVKTPDFTTYLVPGALDLPEIVSVACTCETEETGPFGMKGIGEVAINGPLPAIANAIAHAGGGRVRHAPLSAAAVLRNISDGALENAPDEDK